VCARLIILPPSCADFLEIWDPQFPGTLLACSGFALPFHVYGPLLDTMTLYNVSLRALMWTLLNRFTYNSIVSLTNL